MISRTTMRRFLRGSMIALGFSLFGAVNLKAATITYRVTESDIVDQEFFETFTQGGCCFAFNNAVASKFEFPSFDSSNNTKRLDKIFVTNKTEYLVTTSILFNFASSSSPDTFVTLNTNSAVAVPLTSNAPTVAQAGYALVQSSNSSQFDSMEGAQYRASLGGTSTVTEEVDSRARDAFKDKESLFGVLSQTARFQYSNYLSLDFDILDRVFESSSTVSIQYRFTDLIEPELSDRSVGLTAGSPVTLSQLVDTSSTAFTFDFDYQFQDTDGELVVMLAGEEIAHLFAPSTLLGSFSTESILIDGALLGLTDAELAFTYNGPTGTSIRLDNISYPGLGNGDFDVGDLRSWTITGPGSAAVVDGGAAQVASVPEPSTLVLFGMGLAGLGVLRRRRLSVSSAH